VDEDISGVDGSGIQSNDSSTNSLIEWNRRFQQSSPHIYFHKSIFYKIEYLKYLIFCLKPLTILLCKNN